MEKEKSGFWFSVLKGALIDIITVLAAVLVFAAVANKAGLTAGVIKPVNQFIKIFAAFIGCFFAVKGDKGLLKGAIIGAGGCVLTHLIFLIVGAGIGVTFLIDLAFTAAIGGISGIIAVNVRKQ